MQALAAAQTSRTRRGAAQMNTTEWTAFTSSASAILTPAQFPMLQADIAGGVMERLGGKVLSLLRQGFQKQAAAGAGVKK